MAPANRIKQARRLAGLTQEELARRVGVSQAHISHLETDRAGDVDIAMMRVIAGALGCAPADLLADEDNPDRASDGAKLEGEPAGPNRIKELRLRIGMSQAELARRANAHASTINKIEAGLRRLDQVRMQRLAAILGVAPGELLPQSVAPVDVAPRRGAPNRILELRLAAGLAQVDLGARIGVSKMQISGMERGLREVSLTTLRALGVALGVSAAELLDNDDNPMRLSEAERALVARYREADHSQQRAIDRVIAALLAADT